MLLDLVEEPRISVLDLDRTRVASQGGDAGKRGGKAKATKKAKTAWGTPRPAGSKGYSMTVFVFPPNARIPLHDHPGMRVHTRVLQGTLRADTFDVLEHDGPGRRLLCRRAPPLELTAGDVASLDERRANLHALTAGPEGAAMLDVFSPDYDPANGRNCTYYEFDGAIDEGGDDGIWLREKDDDGGFECRGGWFGMPDDGDDDDDDNEEAFHDSLSA